MACAVAVIVVVVVPCAADDSCMGVAVGRAVGAATAVDAVMVSLVCEYIADNTDVTRLVVHSADVVLIDCRGNHAPHTVPRNKCRAHAA